MDLLKLELEFNACTNNQFYSGRVIKFPQVKILRMNDE